jgi:hypothetical protein
VNDVEARLAEILAEHPGQTGIVFDQENAFAHTNQSSDFEVRIMLASS